MIEDIILRLEKEYLAGVIQIKLIQNGRLDLKKKAKIKKITAEIEVMDSARNTLLSLCQTIKGSRLVFTTPGLDLKEQQFLLDNNFYLIKRERINNQFEWTFALASEFNQNENQNGNQSQNNQVVSLEDKGKILANLNIVEEYIQNKSKDKIKSITSGPEGNVLFKISQIKLLLGVGQ
jgi:ATP sulfurylase